VEEVKVVAAADWLLLKATPAEGYSAEATPGSGEK
jgi:hypothetical protein